MHRGFTLARKSARDAVNNSCFINSAGGRAVLVKACRGGGGRCCTRVRSKGHAAPEEEAPAGGRDLVTGGSQAPRWSSSPPHLDSFPSRFPCFSPFSWPPRAKCSFLSGVTQAAAVVSPALVGRHQRASITPARALAAPTGAGAASEVGTDRAAKNPLTSRRAQICSECTAESTLVIIN